MELFLKWKPSASVYSSVVVIQESQDGNSEMVINPEQDGKDRVYLDLIPVRSFLHTNSGQVSPHSSPTTRKELNPAPAPSNRQHDLGSQVRTNRTHLSHLISPSKPYQNKVLLSYVVKSVGFRYIYSL